MLAINANEVQLQLTVQNTDIGGYRDERGHGDPVLPNVTHAPQLSLLPQQLLNLLSPPQQQQQQQQPAPAPRMELLEQPALFYRFRYPSEVEGTRLGGILQGRAADGRGFVRLRISDIDPTVHCSLHLMACTVSPDRAPHPFQLHGENCKDGYLLMHKTVDQKLDNTWDISFTRLAVICCPKKSKDAIPNAMEIRKEKVPKLHDGPELPDGFSYDARNVTKIRLAFSLSFTDRQGQDWLCPTVYSDEIMDEKERKKCTLDIDSLNSHDVPANCVTEVVIYTITPTSGLEKDRIKVQFIFQREKGTGDRDRETEQTSTDQIVVERDVQDLRKHLLIVKTPDVASIRRVKMQMFPKEERMKCSVSVCYNGVASKESLNIVFFDTQIQSAIPDRKRAAAVK